MTTGTFESRRNIWFRRPHPLSLRTTTEAGETSRFAAHIHPRLRQLPRHPHRTPYCRKFDRMIARRHLIQPRLPLMGLREFVSSSACIRWEIQVGGWIAEALLHSKRLPECKTQCSRGRFPIGWRRGSVLTGKMVWKDNETRTAPTSIYGPDEFIGSWEGRWQRNEVAAVTGWGSEN